MSAHLITIDFAERHRRTPPLGYILALLGLLALALTLNAVRDSASERDVLQSRVDSLPRSARLRGVAAERSTQEGRRVVATLATPWSRLLQELEAASSDMRQQVAVLAIEPDRTRHRIRVVAEARDLTDALSYIERLQHSRVLRMPMLVSHQTRTDEAERPVRFQLSADWRDEL
jgi:hypothetical protein